MAFIPYSNDHKQQSTITVEKSGRICLSAGLRRKLGCENDEVELILFFEEETRRIGLSKDYPGKHKRFKFDRSRGYSDVKMFLHDNDIEYREGSVRYYYDGTYGGVMAFKASKDYKSEGITFKQDSGSLERVK